MASIPWEETFFRIVLFLIGLQGIGSSTYHVLYNDAVSAYNQQRWFECYALLTKAVRDYHDYYDGVAECWSSCQSPSGAAGLVEITAGNFLQPQYLDVAAAKSNCFQKCRDVKFPGRAEPSVSEASATERDFQNLTPYDYLQLCAYKSGQFADAVSAAYTYLVAHPQHEYMENNVKFYQNLPEVESSNFVDREEASFKRLYSKAIESYEEEDWLGAIRYMEESIQQYYGEVRKCTALCNFPLEPSRLQTFLQQTSSASAESDRKRIMLDHWLQILECRNICRTRLDVLENSGANGGYLKEQYNHLQFSYYKLNDLKRAAECTGTYLQINPGDESAIYNREYYSRQHQVIKEDFTPRNDAMRYVDERNKDSLLLQTVRSMLLKYPTSQAAQEGNDQAGPIPAEVYGERDPAFLEELQTYTSKAGVTVFAEGEKLQGEHRVAVDGLVSDEQCRQLVQLASLGALQGDGYSGTEARTSPHTAYEKFEGLTVSRAAQLARDRIVSPDLAKLYLDASESGRAFLEKYLNLKSHLMFQYTHLVCRTALDVNQSDRKDLSHPVHSDNCFIQPDGTCLKRPPAYIYRDFTGLLYLNDEFEGGDFFFAHKNLSLQVALHPKCGRFVGFESDDYHGVLPVTSGRRCALATWYTLNPVHQELAHTEARAILNFIESPRLNPVTSAYFQSLLDQRGAHLSMTEDDLVGSQRFAVDEFTTENQCEQLIKLANMGLTSDGYESARRRLSPHTDYEHFIGMTVAHAAKLAAEHRVTAEAVKLYLGISQDVMEMTRRYLIPDTPLYFSYTHLVCRTALDDKNVDRTDLSHPIHSDNCIIQPDNTCRRIRPAYTERDFSAILYLNDNFNGGNFFFTHQNMTVQSSLRPKCGRVVAFNASHYHGVRPVLSGQRCAVALWFTLDKNFEEAGHAAAWNVLGQLEKQAFGPNEHAHVEL